MSARPPLLKGLLIYSLGLPPASRRYHYSVAQVRDDEVSAGGAGSGAAGAAAGAGAAGAPAGSGRSRKAESSRRARLASAVGLPQMVLPFWAGATWDKQHGVDVERKRRVIFFGFLGGAGPGPPGASSTARGGRGVHAVGGWCPAAEMVNFVKTGAPTRPAGRSSAGWTWGASSGLGPPLIMN